MAVQYISVSYAALNSTDKRLISAPSTPLASVRHGSDAAAALRFKALS